MRSAARAQRSSAPTGASSASGAARASARRSRLTSRRGFAATPAIEITVKNLAIAGLALLLAAPALAAPTVHITSPESIKLNRPFSDATEVGGVLYLSGQIGAVPGEDHVVAGGLEVETAQVMANIGAILAKRGLTHDDLFICTVMLADMRQWDAFNKVYVGFFKPGRFPSRSAMGVSGLARGAAVELECWANTAR